MSYDVLYISYYCMKVIHFKLLWFIASDDIAINQCETGDTNNALERLFMPSLLRFSACSEVMRLISWSTVKFVVFNTYDQWTS